MQKDMIFNDITIVSVKRMTIELILGIKIRIKPLIERIMLIQAKSGSLSDKKIIWVDM